MLFQLFLTEKWWSHNLSTYLYIYLLLLVLFSCSVLSNSFTSPWTVSRQAPLSKGFSRRVLEWVVISISRRSSWPRDQTHRSCIGRWIIYSLSYQGNLSILYRWQNRNFKKFSNFLKDAQKGNTGSSPRSFSFFISFQPYAIILCCVHACVLSHFSYVRLFTKLWTLPRQAPLSMGFSRQEYWSGLPCPPPGDLPAPGTEPISLMSPALAGGFLTTSATVEALVLCSCVKIWHKYCLELYLEPEEGLNLALIFILANMFFSWQSTHWRIRASTSALMVRRQMLSFLPPATCKVYLS